MTYLKSIFLLLFLFLIQLLNAQNVEKTFRPGFYSTPNFIHPYTDNRIVIGGEGRDDFSNKEKPFLAMLDSMGNVLWEYDVKQEFPNEGRVAVKDIFIEDGEILVGINHSCCCDVVSGGINSILKINSSGQLIENLSDVAFPKIKNGDVYATYDFTNFHLLDSTFQIIDGKSLYNPITGNNIIPIITDLIYIEPLYWASTVDSDSTCGLVTFEPTFPYFSINHNCKNFGNIQNLEISTSERIYIQNDDKILEINGSFNQVGELSFADSNHITNFEIHENHVLVFTDSIDKRSIKIYDENFNQLHEVVFEPHLKLLPKYAHLQNNKLYVVGEEHSEHQLIDGLIHIEDDSRSSIFFRLYDLDLTQEFQNHDIGISQISFVDTPESFPVTGCNFFEVPECGGETVNIKYQDISATITNYGIEILNECTVNARFEQCGNCSYFCSRTFTFSKKFENLNLMPSESIEVLFGDIEVDDQKINASHELCLWTANPNNFIDKNISNDQSCITSEVITDIADLAKSKDEFQVFPNPSKIGEVNLHFEFENEEKEIFIHDAVGNEIATYLLGENISDLKIETSDFSKGIYFISIKMEGKSIAKKMIIQ